MEIPSHSVKPAVNSERNKIENCHIGSIAKRRLVKESLSIISSTTWGNKMIIVTPSLTLAQTSYKLSQELGLLRSWTNFLTDNIRGQQQVAGFTLLPCARVNDGRTDRPVYAVDDVEAFIENVKAATPGFCRPVVTPLVLEIDTTRPWQLNLFTKDGKPIISPRTVTHRKPGKKPASIFVARRASRPSSSRKKLSA
jgi:hypothetical protein